MHRGSDSAEQAQAQQELKRMKAQLDRAHQERLCQEAHVLDPEYLSACIQFYRLVSCWMLRFISKQPEPQLPLPLPVVDGFGSLPVSFFDLEYGLAAV